MLHGVRLANGKAEWYRNRFVDTPNITDPLADPMTGMGDLTRGTGNTHVPHTTANCCVSKKVIGHGVPTPI